MCLGAEMECKTECRLSEVRAEGDSILVIDYLEEWASTSVLCIPILTGYKVKDYHEKGWCCRISYRCQELDSAPAVSSS